MSIHKLDVSYRSLRQRVEQFARTLDAPAIDLVAPVEMDEVLRNCRAESRDCDQESRSRSFSKRGRGCYTEDKPLVFTLVDCGSDHRYVILEKFVDELTVRPLLDNHEKEPLLVYTTGFRAYDLLEYDESFQRKAVIHSDDEYVAGDEHLRESCVAGATVVPATPGRFKSKLKPYLIGASTLTV